MNTIGVGHELIISELIGLVARKVPYAEVVRAVEGALGYFDAFGVVCVLDFVVVENVWTVLFERLIGGVY